MYRGLIILLLVMISLCSCSKSNDADEKYIVGYVFVTDQIIEGDSIAAEKLTHINYAFADIRDGVIAEGFKNDEENFRILNKLKERNPDLKILISIGGWTWSGQFSDMSLTEESRKKFIESSINFIDRYQLDGIDIDWEFPNLEGYGNIHRPEDKQNFTYLLRDFRIALDEYGKTKNKHYPLTAAIGAFKEYFDNTEMEKAQQYLDFINIMAYDLYESDYDSVAGHHAALYTHPKDFKNVSVDAAVKRLVQDGVQPEKLVLGVPFYGRAWETKTTENNGLFEPAGEVSKPIFASMRFIKQNLENNNGYVRYWDSLSSVPYLFNKDERIFITYDDEESLQKKSEYIINNKMKGAMFWEYHGDYEHRLLNTLYNALRK